MKRPLSLLEVAIGFALTAILLTALFSSFRHMLQTGATVEKVRVERHWTYITHLRLNQVFETLRKGKLFDTQNRKLKFIFNNGLDPDPRFCGELQAELLLDDKKAKLLLYPTQGEPRCEILKENVRDFSLEYYNLDFQKWEEEWKQEGPPPLLRLTIDGEVFAFSIPTIPKEVRYP